MPSTRSRLLAAFALVALLAPAHPAFSQVTDPYAQARQFLLNEKFSDGAEAFAKLAALNPYDGYVWGNWGYCLHALKRFDEAIPRYLKAIELGEEPASYTYNIACAHSLMGHKDEAFKWLEKALDSRFVDQETLEKDSDLDPIRDDPRFASLTGITKGLKSPLAQSRDDGWKWDLDFYARRMKQMHWDLYGKVSEKTLRAELDTLKRDIPKLSDDQARARLRKITALVGDGHTQCSLTPEGAETRPRLPLHLYSFKDGLYVIGATTEYASLIGSKVLKVGPLDTSAAVAAVRPYISVDNEMGYLDGACAHLVLPAILSQIGAAPDDSGAEFTLAAPGSNPTTVRVKPIDAPTKRHTGIYSPLFTYAHQSSKPPLPLYLRDPAHNLRMDYDADRKLVYFYFGAIANDPDTTLADFTTRLFDFIEKNNAEHLVIDMRFNGGGNTGLIRPLMDALAGCKTINRPGHLWVIIGRRTFSAAQNTVNLMNYLARPIFVGEPTGSSPHFIGESTYFILPNSKTRVYCSSRYWQILDSTDNRTWIPPQIVAELTYADYAANRDPAMEAIYGAIGAPAQPQK